MARRSTAARDLQALELRLAGLNFDQIAERLKFANRGSAYKAYKRALEARNDTSSLTREEAKQLELARLDHLYSRVYAQASRGDLQAVDRALKITATRARIQRLYESVNSVPAGPTAGEAKVIDMAEAAERIRAAVQGRSS